MFSARSSGVVPAPAGRIAAVGPQRKASQRPARARGPGGAASNRRQPTSAPRLPRGKAAVPCSLSFDKQDSGVSADCIEALAGASQQVVQLYRTPLLSDEALKTLLKKAKVSAENALPFTSTHSHTRSREGLARIRGPIATPFHSFLTHERLSFPLFPSFSSSLLSLAASGFSTELN